MAVFLFGSCATTSQQGTDNGSSEDQKRTKAEGAAVGALVGGVLGYALGGGSRVVGTLVGAAVGAGAGYVLGNEIAKRKQKYASEEAFLDAEIQSTQQFNQTARDYNNTLRAQIADLDRTTMALRTRYNVGSATQQDLKKKRAEIKQKLSQSEEFYQQLKQEYDIKVAIYDEQQKKRKQNDSYLVKLEEEIVELKSNLDQLSAGSKQLASIDERLVI
jgi:gas vesicle protein